MKKVILVIMGIVCLLVVGKAQAQCTFSDVPESHVFYDYITGMCEAGITTGYPDGTYRPAQNVTRGQMSAFTMRAIDSVVIKVYDASDQYLGNFAGFLENYSGDGDTYCLNIFVPSLKKVVCIAQINGEMDNFIPHIYYKGSDCTGEAYSWLSLMYKIVKVDGKYYTGSASPDIFTYDSEWRYGSCNNNQGEQLLVPVNEISPPFALPVALPMRLE